MKTIIFPTDFSHAGDAALSLAASLARDMKAELLLVHVEEPPIAYGGGELYYGVPDPVHEDLLKMLEAVSPGDDAIPVRRRMLSGAPADAIVRLAESEDADMIIMGTHGRAGVARLLMGSVAEAVVRRAKCPVLTYRQPASAEASS